MNQNREKRLLGMIRLFFELAKSYHQELQELKRLLMQAEERAK
jgi:hypothetical protein